MKQASTIFIYLRYSNSHFNHNFRSTLDILMYAARYEYIFAPVFLLETSEWKILASNLTICYSFPVFYPYFSIVICDCSDDRNSQKKFKTRFTSHLCDYKLWQEESWKFITVHLIWIYNIHVAIRQKEKDNSPDSYSLHMNKES